MKQFDIGDKVIVDNPSGSFHEKLRGMKGRVKYTSNNDKLPSDIEFIKTVILEFDTNKNMCFEFSVDEVSLIE